MCCADSDSNNGAERKRKNSCSGASDLRIDSPAIPRAYLIRVHLVLGRDPLDRLAATERFQRHPGLEVDRKPTPISHLVFLRYPVEYTLNLRPIFWNHVRTR